MVWIICVKKIKIAVEKNKKSQKAPYKTTTQNGASLLEAIVGRRQWCFIFWDSFGNRETPNLSEGPCDSQTAVWQYGLSGSLLSMV